MSAIGNRRISPAWESSHRPEIRLDFVQESFAIGRVCTPSERLARILTRLVLEQINCEQREQKIRNEHRCASIILCDSLPKKQRNDRNCGDDCATECDCRISQKKQKHTAKRAQYAGRELEDCDGSQQRGNSSRQWALGKMSFQPFQVSAPIGDLVD